MKGLSRRVWILLIVLLGILLTLFIFVLALPRSTTASIPDTLSPWMTYEVINRYPHDPGAFTQGLIYLDGYLYESTGLYGESSLRKVALETGEVLKQVDLPQDVFGEGLTVWDETLLQLTWREGTGFVYDLETFALMGQFSYPMEGWGLTHDGERLILSDGTSTLYYVDPNTYQITGRVNVTYQGEEIERLNELEFIRGEVFANIWQTDRIVRINPHTGEVTGWIDLGGILDPGLRTPDTDVLNGIAYDPAGDRLFVTGKRWPVLYQIRLVPGATEE
jgi:glutaminyl-peptide cyclotransferase